MTVLLFTSTKKWIAISSWFNFFFIVFFHKCYEYSSNTHDTTISHQWLEVECYSSKDDLVDRSRHEEEDDEDTEEDDDEEDLPEEAEEDPQNNNIFQAIRLPQYDLPLDFHVDYNTYF